MNKCKTCDKEFEQNKNGNKQYCSITCRNSKKVRNTRRNRKQKAIDYKGGKCERCGYCKCNSALTFHHLDPSQKDFGIGGRGENKSWEKTKAELDKCIMLCANCHAEEHERLDRE